MTSVHSFADLDAANPAPYGGPRTMRIAQLALFPIHLLPGFEKHTPRGHYPTWLSQLSRAWTDTKDLDIHWITIVRHIEKSEVVRWRGQTFHLLRRPEKLRPFRLYRKDCQLIKRELAALKPDLIHAWGTEDCYGLAAALSGQDFLLSMQGILTEYADAVRPNIFERLQAWIERFILARTKHVTVESHWGARVLKRRVPRAQIHQVEYGVEDLFFDVQWKPERAKPVAVFVGTSTPRKGLQDAVAAFAHPDLTDKELWILGDRGTPLANELERHSTANVKWLGRRSRSETAELMSQAWCLVLPTRSDTSPNVVKESRVIGLPVITTPHGGQIDYIKDGENGWIVEPGAIPALQDRLIRVLSDYDGAVRLGQNHQQEQREWFRPENTAAGFERLYRQLVHGNKEAIA
jgi:glycosyltransferase involved in cell wall biosynthesis